MNFLKPVIAGILFGALFFFLPFFIFRIAGFILILALLFRVFAGRRFRSGRGWGNRMAFTDHIRNRRDGDYDTLKPQFNSGGGRQRTAKSSPIEIKIV